MIVFKNALLSDGRNTDILVKDGKIVEIGRDLTADRVVNCEGRLLLSGMIDSHVHFREPGLTQKEDAESGTKAALRGGVTSIIDMPNTAPLCVTPLELQNKKDIYRRKAFSNYGFHFGGDARDNSANLPPAGSYAALKIFLNESTGHMLITDDEVLENLFRAAPLIAVHAEGDAVDKAVYYAEKYGNTLYLCHISLEEELKLIRRAKERGLPVYAEACPHHVLFDRSMESELLVMKPGLRSARDRELMLEAVDSGLIDTWGTDHAPHLISEKQSALTYGIPAVEFALEILMTLAKQNSWGFNRVESLYSSTPAHIFGIKNKGAVEVGKDADFVLVDYDRPYTISQKDAVSKCGWTPYEGFRAESSIHSVYIGGETVYDGNQFYKSPYAGELEYDR